MSVKRVASRYAKSILDLAIDQNSLEKVHEDMQAVQGLIKDSKDFAAFLKSPVVQYSKKQAILEKLLSGKVDTLTLKFILLLTGKQRETILSDIVDAFMEQYRILKHISVVRVTSAAPLTPAQMEALQRKIEASSVGFEHVEIQTKVDPSLIGGFIVELDNKILDGSVRHHLDNLRREFTTNLYESKIMAR